MKKKITSIALCAAFFLLSFCQTALAGGPWLLPKGKSYWKFSGWGVASTSYFDAQGKVQPSPAAGIFNTSLYAEYGISDRLNAVLFMPFFSRAYEEAPGGVSGLPMKTAISSFGDTDLGFKYRLNKSGARVALSGTVLLGLPFGNPSGGVLQRLQTGDGEFNQLVKIDAGTSWGKNYDWYGSAYLGANRRSKGFSEEARYGAEIGRGFMKKRFWAIARLNGVYSLKNGKTPTNSIGTTIFANNTEFMGIGLDFACYLSKKVGISAGAAGAFYGKVIYASPSFTAGVFLDLK